MDASGLWGFCWIVLLFGIADGDHDLVDARKSN